MQSIEHLMKSVTSRNYFFIIQNDEFLFTFESLNFIVEQH